jgi:hypothetical protein
MTPIGTGLDDLVLRTVQEAYMAGKVAKTKDCMEQEQVGTENDLHQLL